MNCIWVPANSIRSPFFRGQGHAVDGGAGQAFDVGDDIAPGPLGDGRDLHPRLADGRDDLGERDLAAGSGAAQDLDGRRQAADPGTQTAQRGTGTGGGRVEGAVPGRRARMGPGRDRPGPHDHGLLVVAAFLDQVLDLVLADLDRVVVGQQLLLDGLAVDVRAVGAVEVFDEDVLAHHLKDCVLAADGEVVDHDVVVRTAPEGGLVLGDLDFLDNHTIERHHQLAHACPCLVFRVVAWRPDFVVRS
jgi:hypothetical protein